MRAVPVSQLTCDMVLAMPLHAVDGEVLMPPGAKLTGGAIATMEALGYAAAYVADPRIPDARPNQILPAEVRSRVLRATASTFRSGTVDLPAITEAAAELVGAIEAAHDLSIELIDLKRHADYDVTHAVNVALLGAVLGHELGLSPQQLRELTVGLLLHDIGNLAVPEAVLDKPGKLTDDEFRQMTEHVRAGFELLRRLSLSANAKIVALQHHEKYDGTGYPKGLKGHDIHPNGQIAAIADVFDSLCSDRLYRKRFWLHEAVAYLRDQADRHFADELVTRFTSLVSPYPPGTAVKLSTGETALVVRVDRKVPARPLVRVIGDPVGATLTRSADLELSRVPDVAIAKVLEA